QVYLHKTVLAADCMLTHIMHRAKELAQQQALAAPSEALLMLLQISSPNSLSPSAWLEWFMQLDDCDVLTALKQWQKHGDRLLSMLCTDLLQRRLFRIELQRQPIDTRYLERLRQACCEQLLLTRPQAERLVAAASTSDHAYDPTSDLIRIRFRDGRVHDISEVSQLINIAALRQPDVKYYVCYPRQLRLDRLC
ncbi:MAG: hypothetical protein RMK52_08855, partial [Chitinophagales bacterium]|nr:hypothetical protein [Chitinophagales bacterium]